MTTARTATPPEGRRQPTEESGDCSDCSSGCVAAHPTIQVRLLDLLHEVYSALIQTEKDVKTDLSGPVDSKFEATADNIKTEANKPMKHAYKERGTQQ